MKKYLIPSHQQGRDEEKKWPHENQGREDKQQCEKEGGSPSSYTFPLLTL